MANSCNYFCFIFYSFLLRLCRSIYLLQFSMCLFFFSSSRFFLFLQCFLVDSDFHLSRSHFHAKYLLCAHNPQKRSFYCGNPVFQRFPFFISLLFFTMFRLVFCVFLLVLQQSDGFVFGRVFMVFVLAIASVAWELFSVGVSE